MLASVCINPLVSNATFPYHLKTSENQGVEKGCVGSEWDNDLTNGLSYNAHNFWWWYCFNLWTVSDFYKLTKQIFSKTKQMDNVKRF